MYFVGADCGGTKSAFVLVDETGRVYARYRGAACTFLGYGKAAVQQRMAEGIAQVCNACGITPDDISCLGLGISGYGEAVGSEQDVLEACEAALGKGRAVCQCDSHVGWAGSLGLQAGINVIAGTGSIVYGVNEKGESQRSSGWGAYCDEGSCRWHGSRLIQTFTKQADGRLPKTKLYHMFRAHFAIESDHYFVHFLNHELAKGPNTAKLQILLEEICAAGDDYARAIYQEGARELWMGIDAVARKLGMAGKKYKVSYSGGLFKAGAWALDPLGELVSRGGAQLCAPLFEPDVGSALMAINKTLPGLDLSGFSLKE